MSLTKEAVVRKIEVVYLDDADPVVQVKEVTKIFENGAVISEGVHRYTLSSGDDYSTQPDRVQTICSAIWSA